MKVKKIMKESEIELEGFLGVDLSKLPRKSDNIITEEKVTEIMKYLNEKYDFLEVIYKGNSPVISIMGVELKKFNSLCQVYKTLEGERRYEYFLFNIKENLSPVAVFFHELGHTIHSEFTNGTFEVSKDSIDIAMGSGFTIDRLPHVQQKEVIADLFAMGLMYGTPYEKEDHFTMVLDNSKELLKMWVENVIEACKE